MKDTTPCPVPLEQRPLQEFCALCDSCFFAWPRDTQHFLNRALLISWLLILPISTLVASGSTTLRKHPSQLFLAAAVASIALPLLLLVRQWLGWTYVHRRLMDHRIEYEESGWYDGQVWEKPLAWRQQDYLVARHQVGPILSRLARAMALAAGLMLGGAGLCQAF